MESSPGFTSTPRFGENEVMFGRHDRFFCQGDEWYLHTREGYDVGPYDDKNDAQLALMYFVEHTLWPDQDDLHDFARKS